MKRYTVTELTSKIVEYPEGVKIDGLLYSGVALATLMRLVVQIDDTMLDAIVAFRRKLTETQQQAALLESWED